MKPTDLQDTVGKWSLACCDGEEYIIYANSIVEVDNALYYIDADMFEINNKEVKYVGTGYFLLEEILEVY